MLMTDIYHYIELNGRTTLLDLSRHFHIQESAMQHMLTFWVKKGKIALIDTRASHDPVSKHFINNNLTDSYLKDSCPTGKHCSDCFECSDSHYQVYIHLN